MKQYEKLFHECKCYYCNRTFLKQIGTEYVYKMRYRTSDYKFFCSWNCLRKFQREKGKIK